MILVVQSKKIYNIVYINIIPKFGDCVDEEKAVPLY